MNFEKSKGIGVIIEGTAGIGKARNILYNLGSMQ
jgi:hypothetical protein